MSKNVQVRSARKGDRNLIVDSLLLTNKVIPNFYSTEVLSYLDKIYFKSILIDNVLCGIVLSDNQEELTKCSVFDIRMFAFGYLNGLESQLGFLDYSPSNAKRGSFEDITLNTLARKEVQRGSARRQLNSVLVLGPEIRNLKLIETITKKGFRVVRYEDKIGNSLDPKCFRLILVNGYEHRIPALFLENAISPTVNLHPTFLPYGRGIGTTLYAALLNQPFGVSIHIINSEDIDVGPVLFRKELNPSNTETTRSFYSILIKELDTCLASNIDDLLEYEFVGVEQSSLVDETIQYFSRENFENLVKILPKGYDTKLSLLKEFGYLMQRNRQVLTDFQNPPS